MEATSNCTTAISALQKAGHLARKIIDAAYAGYVRLLCSHLVVAWSHVMSYIRNTFEPLIMLYVRYSHLGPTYMG